MKNKSESSILLVGLAIMLLGQPLIKILPVLCEKGVQGVERIVMRWKESSHRASVLIKTNSKVREQAFRDAEKVALSEKPRPTILVEVGRFGSIGDKMPLFGKADFFSCSEGDQFVYLFETRTQPPGPIYSYRSCCRVRGEAIECRAFKT
jgi:hypothetical protein